MANGWDNRLRRMERMAISIDEIKRYELPPITYSPALYMTDQELFQRGSEVTFDMGVSKPKNTLIFDVECYRNFFMIAFMDYETGKVTVVEESPGSQINKEKLRWIAEHYRLIGFNSWGYDEPMLWASITGLWPIQLKNLSDSLILQDRFGPSQAEKEWSFKIGMMDSIDLFNVAPDPSPFMSLKHYGGRMNAPRLQDLPFHPDQDLTAEQAMIIRHYCFDDLVITAFLFSKLQEEITLREAMGLEYGADLRSRSDAQIAERVIVESIQSSTGLPVYRPKREPGRKFSYQIPPFIQFHTPLMQGVLDVVRESWFELDKGGRPMMPEHIGKLRIKIGSSVYNLGMGGLHSQEKQVTHNTTDEHVLIDRDVESYYPRIILNQELFPAHIGPEFLETYTSIVDRRVAAKGEIAVYKTSDPARSKAAKRVSDSLKICINGSFGKLGSPYSKLYSPELMLQVTLTGQLSLLMLIEMCEYCNIPVVSANTDGIVIKCPRDKEAHLLQIVEYWEKATDFKTEETRYRSLHSRDVNTYIAITEDGKFKAKGAYTCDLSRKNKNRESLMGNCKFEICNEAAMLFLRDETPIEKTIRNCKDINKFVAIQKVNKGAVKDKVYLGKVIRWYMKVNEFGQICNASSGNRIPDTAGGYPIMNFTEFPNDIDYGYYIQRSIGILKDVGYFKDTTQGMLFE